MFWKTWIVVLVMSCACAAGTVNAQSNSAQVNKLPYNPLIRPAPQELTGHWRVMSVEKNGEFTAAQIGQQPGDVITIKPGNSFTIS